MILHLIWCGEAILIYFRLRIGVENLINIYLRLRICVIWGEILTLNKH